MKEDNLCLQNDWYTREEDLWRYQRSDGIDMKDMRTVVPDNHNEIEEEWLILYEYGYPNYNSIPSVLHQVNLYDDIIIIDLSEYLG